MIVIYNRNTCFFGLIIAYIDTLCHSILLAHVALLNILSLIHFNGYQICDLQMIIRITRNKTAMCMINYTQIYYI